MREQPELEGLPQLPLMEKAIAIDPKRWELDVGNKPVAFEKLKYGKATTKLFAPPMDEARDLTSKIAWITASGDKFVAN